MSHARGRSADTIWTLSISIGDGKSGTTQAGRKEAAVDLRGSRRESGKALPRALGERSPGGRVGAWAMWGSCGHCRELKLVFGDLGNMWRGSVCLFDFCFI